MRTESAVIAPGQDALVNIGSEWLGAPGMTEVAEEIRDVSQTHTDVTALLRMNVRERPKTPLDAHMLLTAVAGVVEKNLHLTPDAASGHSAGLPVGLFFLGGYADELAGLTSVMERRALLLEEAQLRYPGAMYAFLWKGPHGFAGAEAALTGKRNMWLACYNWENDRAAQVVLTARESVDMAAVAERFDNARLLTRLAIGVGAHSPLVTRAAAEFARWLLSERGIFRTPREGTVFVSDHRVPEHPGVVFDDTSAILDSLGSIGEPVRFQEAIQAIHDQHIGRIIEVGSSSLGNMIVKMGIPDLSVLSIDTPDALREMTEAGDSYETK